MMKASFAPNRCELEEELESLSIYRHIIGKDREVKETARDYLASLEINEKVLEFTPLHQLAQIPGAHDLIEFCVIALNADMEIKDYQNNTALNLASWGSEDEIANVLIRLGADVNNTETCGWILWIAVQLDMKKWIRFPYSELTNCTKVEIGALHSEIDVDLKENLLVECYEKIRCQMPWLKKFATDRMVDSTMALEIFQNSNLTSIELGDISDNFYLVATMAGLNSLFIADPFNLKDFRCTLPNISKLEIVEFDQISNADLSEIFSNIPKVFPGIDALIIGLDVPEMLHFLPENIDKIEIILYSPISPNIPEDLVVNRLCVSVINICFDTDDLTPLRLVLNNANTWVLTIGMPAFLIISNHDNFSDIFNWFPSVFELRSSNSDDFLFFENRVYKNLYFHLCRARANENAKEHNYKANTYSWNVLNDLGNDEIIKWYLNLVDFDSPSENLTENEEISGESLYE